jgi:hypothetical protein
MLSGTNREVAMGTAADKIFEEALSLPADERAGLVERLIQKSKPANAG